MSDHPERVKFGPLISAGAVLGFGLGGFLDGIFLHQILQWHNMLSNRIPVVDLVTAKTNMVWDGYFHLAVWIATMTGLVMLFNAGKRKDVAWSGKVLAGAWIFGWGVFNILDSVVNHYILRLHNVYEYTTPANQALYNHLFLIGPGIIFAVVGWSIIMSGKGSWRSAGP
jgi:uncharacterized membrane protein